MILLTLPLHLDDLNNNYSESLSEHKGYSDPEMRDDDEGYRQKRMMYDGNSAEDMYRGYYGNNYQNSWPFPARRLRSASFAHVLRV